MYIFFIDIICTSQVRSQRSDIREKCSESEEKVFNDIDAEMKIAQGSIQLPVLSLRGLVFVTKCFD